MNDFYQFNIKSKPSYKWNLLDQSQTIGRNTVSFSNNLLTSAKFKCSINLFKLKTSNLRPVRFGQKTDFMFTNIYKYDLPLKN